jgi:hypothetical protein
MIIHFLSFLNFAFTLGSLQKQSSGFPVNKLLLHSLLKQKKLFLGKEEGMGILEQKVAEELTLKIATPVF